MTIVPLDSLAATLGFQEREHIAVVGGGGKTTIVIALGQQLRGRVIVTTTTKMGVRQTGGFPTLVSPTDDHLRTMAPSGPVMVRSDERGTKAIGVATQQCDRWFSDRSICDHIVIEADGSRTRPFKAPAPHEPMIPESVTTVLSVIGANALGRVIADQCQRPLRVAAVAGCSPYERLTPARAATVLLSPRGGGKSVPPHARRIVVIANAPTADADPVAAELVSELIDALTGTIAVLGVERMVDKVVSPPW